MYPYCVNPAMSKNQKQLKQASL